MVLRDSLFENMTYDDWTVSLTSTLYFLSCPPSSSESRALSRPTPQPGTDTKRRWPTSATFFGQSAVSLDLGFMRWRWCYCQER
ncbi:hypothetical protein K505DRAFT_106867 [Melanomma pulvis-pyrius CBS 109.77]|uniref:Uncharacterized protein n=1 Tax=Melanomma pulvis-pyrius CBS 109.77 TaxID=1314802 RepID=A0A6A6XS85_9PLEO|nr:hypothetical protein K505DRAFT_106867 [Melanomma pulvis-pyrius CBS 109.77]